MAEQSAVDISSARYCRGCGYDLRATSNRCPECGRAFDPANHRSFYAHARSYFLRRWIRRGLLLLAMMIGLPGGGLLWLWWGWHLEQSPRSAFVEMGDKALDAQMAGDSPPPPRHIDYLGDEFFDLWGEEREMVYPFFPGTRGLCVETISPWVSRVLPGNLKFLTERLSDVDLIPVPPSPASLADADLERVGACRYLRSLQMKGLNAVSEAGLRNIWRLTLLESLTLEGDCIDDKALAHIAALTRLQRLRLCTPRVTDEGMRYLCALPRLTFLCLSAPITDAGIAHLAKTTQLQSLYLLSATNITDQGVSKLAGLSRLQRLDLSRTKITDAVVESLARMQNLRFLRMRDTSISAAACAHLRRALPKTQIVPYWPPDGNE